ncbi:MAG TPA: selenide, water dikinase SelD [Bacteroidia bacterium]|nr:selenide, water dikinase SelD [Bacteroidia bacterium]
MSTIKESIQLTKYSHGAGCGCKIAPEVLDSILEGHTLNSEFKNLLVGNNERDDAAAIDLGNGSCLLSTTDFFMPIVDDPTLFGKIAATNSISDIYAMGGKPILAIAILGWPIDKIDVRYAGEVIKGARLVCAEAGIPLAGGHSIDSPEPIFGLAVNGIATRDNLKRNNTAQVGDLLFLSKPLGVGVLTTAVKKGLCSESDIEHAIVSMTSLNKIGERLGELNYVHALTDVTGFGLLGHLIEMTESSNVSAQLKFEQIPILDAAFDFIEKGSIPGGTKRNLKSYGHKLANMSMEFQSILADPQTSGGLLISVNPKFENEFQNAIKGFDELNCLSKPIGRVVVEGKNRIEVL